MAWFKVDDMLAFHTKTLMAGNEAMGLWVRAASWSCAHLTDGFIPQAVSDSMANREFAMRLLMANLWEEVDGGFQFHDWSDFQPSGHDEAERRENLRKARSSAGKRGAAKRWGDGKTTDLPYQSNGKPMASGMASAWQSNSPEPEPEPITTTNVVVNVPSEQPTKTAVLEAEFANKFWPAYPRKVNKANALKAFIKARKTTDLTTILDGLSKYANSQLDPNYIAHPSTWLNGKRWEDEVTQGVITSSRMVNARSTYDTIEGMDFPEFES